MFGNAQRQICRAFFLMIAPALLAPQKGLTATDQASAPDMVLIPAAVYRPLFLTAADPKEVPLRAFYLDKFPVTRGAFLEFVRANPGWRRSQVKRIFADASYLKDWAGDLDPGNSVPLKAPVTSVSWFAAKAFAKWRGERLPTLAEWE